MRFDDFDLALVRTVVRGLASSFYTGDVSGDSRMLQHHKVSRVPKVERHTYLKMTGKFLSMNPASLGLRLERDSKLMRQLSSRFGPLLGMLALSSLRANGTDLAGE